MLILARLLSKVGAVFSIPTLVAELLAGIMLGPTILGMLYPQAYSFFFPIEGNLPNAYATIFDLSVVMLLFIAGVDLDLNLLTKKKKAVVITSLFGVILPFALAFVFAWQYFDFLHGIEISAAPFIFPLIFATLISVSSLPIISRILMSYNITNTDIGITILGVAIVSDLIGWFSYSSIMVYANASVENTQILYTLFYLIGFFVVIFFISGQKKLMGMLFSEKASSAHEHSYDLAMLFGICLLTAAFTSAIHIHASLGAFIAGIVCRRIIGDDNPILKQIELFIINFFAPIFFISIGLKIDFIKNFNFWMVIVVFLFACSIKLIGAYIGTRLSGIKSKPASAIATCLTTQGTLGVIMGALALKAGLIGSQLFVAVVITSIGTSLLVEVAVIKILNLNKA